MVDKPQTSKEPVEETPKETGKEGKPETTPISPGLTEKETEELARLRRQFPESAKEAQRLAKRVKELEDKLEEILPPLSEEELIKENPDYEMMTDAEKAGFKEGIITKRRLAILEAKEKMRRDYDTLPDNLKKKIEAKGGYEKFKDFACSPENAGQKDLTNIAKAYLFEEEELTPKLPEQPERPGLEEPGHETELPPLKQEGEMTAEEAANLRTTDPKKYNQLLKDKKLKIVEK